MYLILLLVTFPDAVGVDDADAATIAAAAVVPYPYP